MVGLFLIALGGCGLVGSAYQLLTMLPYNESKSLTVSYPNFMKDTMVAMSEIAMGAFLVSSPKSVHRLWAFMTRKSATLGQE